MKLYLASFFQPENHGHGRKLSIADGIPNDIVVDGEFEHFIPKGMKAYYQNRFLNPKTAGDNFVKSYSDQLSELYENLCLDSKAENKSFEELLPFKDGDTLLSWEKAGNMSFRIMLNEFLIKLGYETVLK